MAKIDAWSTLTGNDWANDIKTTTTTTRTPLTYVYQTDGTDKYWGSEILDTTHVDVELPPPPPVAADVPECDCLWCKVDTGHEVNAAPREVPGLLDGMANVWQGPPLPPPNINAQNLPWPPYQPGAAQNLQPDTLIVPQEMWRHYQQVLTQNVFAPSPFTNWPQDRTVGEGQVFALNTKHIDGGTIDPPIKVEPGAIHMIKDKMDKAQKYMYEKLNRKFWMED